MKVITIKDIKRKDIPIYYRLMYTGVAVIELAKGPMNFRIDFSIEIKATGQMLIVVTFIDQLDYPLFPVVQELKKIITDMHYDGTLPN